MRLDTHSRQEIIKANYRTCRRAGKKWRGEIPDRLAPVTGLNRDYPVAAPGRYAPEERAAGTGRKKRTEGTMGGRPPVYRSAAFLKAPAGIRDFFGYPRGKPPAPPVRENTGFPEESKEIDFGITAETRPLLTSVSPAEAGILLKPEIRGKSLTKAGTALKNGIPVRTFSKRDGRKPGFSGPDRVARCGNAAEGRFSRTLAAAGSAPAGRSSARCRTAPVSGSGKRRKTSVCPSRSRCTASIPAAAGSLSTGNCSNGAGITG